MNEGHLEKMPMDDDEPMMVGGTGLICNMMLMYYEVPRTCPESIPGAFWPMKPKKMDPVVIKEWGTCRLCGSGSKIEVKLGFGACVGCHHAHINELFCDGRFVWHIGKKIWWPCTPSLN